MHGGQQTGYHRISGISSHLLRARGSNIKVLIISMLPSTAIYNPPRLSEKSRRELKSLYPTTGATTNFQSSEVVIILLRQSPPRMLCTIGECPSPPKNFGNVQNSGGEGHSPIFGMILGQLSLRWLVSPVEPQAQRKSLIQRRIELPVQFFYAPIVIGCLYFIKGPFFGV